jgi:hypothetical protein
VSRVTGAAVLAALLVSNTARAADGPAPSPPDHSDDALLSEPGRFMVTAASGIPFLALGELAYGVSRGFSIGALAAATPDTSKFDGTSAVGLRPRGVLLRSGSWRSVLVVSALYYPSIQGFGGERDPWVLVRPEVLLERRFDGGGSVNAGLGLIAAACVESIVTLGKEHDPTDMGGIWNTVRLGGSVPLEGPISLFGEASLVMRGVVLADQWIGMVPVVAVAGVTVRL